MGWVVPGEASRTVFGPMLNSVPWKFLLRVTLAFLLEEEVLWVTIHGISSTSDDETVVFSFNFLDLVDFFRYFFHD